MTQDDIFKRVKKQLVEALSFEDEAEDKITLASRLGPDLGAESNRVLGISRWPIWE